MITEDYVSFEIAKLLKKKGFNEDCYTCYLIDEIQHYDYKSRNRDLIEGVISAPTLQMARKWLRKVHNIHIESLCPVVDTTDEPMTYNVVISDLRNHCLAFDTPLNDKEYDTYEQACEAACIYALKNLI